MNANVSTTSTSGAGDNPEAVQHSPQGNDSGKNKKARSGLGHRQKRMDDFARKKNKEFQAKIEAEDKAFHDSFKSYKGVLDCFGSRTVTKQYNPPIQVEVATDIAVDIIDKTVDILYSACKIPPCQEADPIAADKTTLMQATALQLDAKVANAQANTQFASVESWNEFDVIERATNLFDKALLPIAYLIHQVGKVSVCNQTIIPKASPLASLSLSSMEVENNRIRHKPLYQRVFCGPQLPELSFPTGSMASDGGRMKPVYFRIFERQRAYEAGLLVTDGRDLHLNLEVYSRMTWAERREFGEDITHEGNVTFPPLAEVHGRYTELCSRIEKKLSQHAFSPLGLKAAIGTQAQLVGVHQQSGPEDRVAVCARPIEDQYLHISALLGLGLGTEEPLHSDEIALSRSNVDATGAVENLASMLTKRLR